MHGSVSSGWWVMYTTEHAPDAPSRCSKPSTRARLCASRPWHGSSATSSRGLLATDLMANTLSAWMVPLVKMGMAPVADTDENMGLQHAMILASENVTKRRVSYWAAPRLEAREAHPLSMQEDTINFIWDELEALRKREPPEVS